MKKYSFLCDGNFGYWIFENREYQVDGGKTFGELTNVQKDGLAIAHVYSDFAAILVVNALNAYDEAGRQ